MSSLKYIDTIFDLTHMISAKITELEKFYRSQQNTIEYFIRACIVYFLHKDEAKQIIDNIIVKNN